MDTSHTPRTVCVPPFLGAALCVVALLGLGACRDAPTDPMVGLVAAEAGGALAMGVVLPDPSAWGAPGLDAEADRAVEAWQRSWELPLPEARRIRASAYPSLVRGAAAVVTPDALTQETAALAEGVRRAVALDVTLLPSHVAAGLVEASAQHAEAVAAAARGDTEALLTALIRGGDALREVGPEAVARDLVAQAEIAMGRVSPDDPYSDQDLERLRRLIQGGRQAVDDGDWVLAIRRAYYAKGLMNENSRGPS